LEEQFLFHLQEVEVADIMQIRMVAQVVQAEVEEEQEL
jgi:hypothetical protein